MPALLRVRVDIDDAATPFLKRLVVAFHRPGRSLARKLLFDLVAVEAELLTRRHLRDMHRDPSRHKTANALGAEPSGHYLRAARAVTSGTDRKGAFVEIPSEFGLSRAFRDYEIKPVDAKYLTIPANKESYARRAREFDDLKVVKFASGTLALARRERKKTVVMFWLVDRAEIKKDRTLLPSNKDFQESAEIGARRTIDELKRRKDLNE